MSSKNRNILTRAPAKPVLSNKKTILIKQSKINNIKLQNDDLNNNKKSAIVNNKKIAPVNNRTSSPDNNRNSSRVNNRTSSPVNNRNSSPVNNRNSTILKNTQTDTSENNISEKIVFKFADENTIKIIKINNEKCKKNHIAQETIYVYSSLQDLDLTQQTIKTRLIRNLESIKTSSDDIIINISSNNIKNNNLLLLLVNSLQLYNCDMACVSNYDSNVLIFDNYSSFINTEFPFACRYKHFKKILNSTIDNATVTSYYKTNLTIIEQIKLLYKLNEHSLMGGNNYKQKYLKYKQKYLELKRNI